VTRVHWLLLAHGDLPSGEGWLAPAERARLAGLHLPKRRAEWLLGRWTAKQAVLTRVPAGAAAADIEIRAAPDGAPEVLLRGRPAPLAVSLSHRAGLALCTVGPASTALGCDLELVEPRSRAFVADYLTAAERALVERAGPNGRALAVTLVWSAKESALKVLRAGLRLDTRDVVVELPGLPGETPASEGCPGGAAPAGRWCPLAVRHPAGGQRFTGWWRQDADRVTTVVAVPAPDRPERLAAGGVRLERGDRAPSPEPGYDGVGRDRVLAIGCHFLA
jgi:4'-phosphopantetheinyl transferase